MPWQSLIVPTHFSPPRVLPQSVARTRLLTELQAALSRKAVLLTATAGFGKTTLMAQWAEMLTAAGRDVAWVTLGHGEGDLQTFFSYVLEALKLVGVDMHQTTPAALPNRDFGKMRDMVGHIVNEIAEHPKNVTLIIDDIHHLSDARAHSALRDLIEQSTENFQVTLSGRFLPPIPLSRLRLAGQVMEFTSEELAFDDEEIRQFFSARNLIAVPGQLREAREIFGGWPAGMQLLSLAGHRARQQGSLVDLLQTGEGVREYVRENILVNLEPDQVVFVERVSLLPRFCPSLAAAVTGFADAEARIRELERMHIFISKFAADGRYTWYLLHPLFANAVKPIQQERSDEILRCHDRAARWFAANGFLLEAVNHAKDAGGLISPSEVLEAAPMSVRSLSQLGSMRRLMETIDPSELHPDSKLLPLAAWSFLLTAQLRQARRWAACIDPERSPEFALQRRIIDAGIHLYCDDTASVEQLVGHLDPLDIEQPFLRQCLATEIITADQAAGRFQEADRRVSEFTDRFRGERDEMALIVHSLKPVGLLAQGLASSAEQHGLRVLRDAEQTAGPRSVSAAIAASFLAEAQYELDRPEEARATLAGRWHMLYYSPPDPLVRGMLTQARTAACLAGPTAAANLLADALPRFQMRGSDRALALLLHERIRVELLAGRMEQARAELQSLHELAERNVGAAGFLAEVGYIYSLAQARLLLTENAPAAALRHLESARAEGARLHRARIEAKSALLAARCYEALHRPAEALAAAQRAIDLSEPGGMRRTILDQGSEVVAYLVSHASRLRISAELLLALRKSSALDPGVHELISSGGTRQTSSGERLTPRELEIAELLAQSMSNKRIAAALGISPATVKWNLQNIFLKLGVNTRYEVITWLRHGRPA